MPKKRARKPEDDHKSAAHTGSSQSRSVLPVAQAQRSELTQQQIEDIQQQIALTKQQMRLRLWRGANFVTICIYHLVVYGSAIGTTSLILSVSWRALQSEFTNYPHVSEWVSYARIGIAIMGVMAMIVHGMYSAWGQVQIDRDVARQEEEV